MLTVITGTGTSNYNINPDRYEEEIYNELRNLSALVIELKADGYELNLIRSRYTGIRNCHGTMIKWGKDDAQFILSNWD